VRSNQLRLWFASLAYVPLTALRRIEFAGTVLAVAGSMSLRLKLLKIGATVTRPSRRIKFAMASGFPLQETFANAHESLAAAARTWRTRQRKFQPYPLPAAPPKAAKPSHGRTSPETADNRSNQSPNHRPAAPLNRAMVTVRNAG
jgi:hypothetical protein